MKNVHIAIGSLACLCFAVVIMRSTAAKLGGPLPAASMSGGMSSEVGSQAGPAPSSGSFAPPGMPNVAAKKGKQKVSSTPQSSLLLKLINYSVEMWANLVPNNGNVVYILDTIVLKNVAPMLHMDFRLTMTLQ